MAGAGPIMMEGQPPAWTTYVSVTDADDAIAKVKAAGGTVFVEPMDVLDVGRMAVFADPTGAAAAVWQPRLHIGAGLVNEAGCTGLERAVHPGHRCGQAPSTARCSAGRPRRPTWAAWSTPTGSWAGTTSAA